MCRGTFLGSLGAWMCGLRAIDPQNGSFCPCFAYVRRMMLPIVSTGSRETALVSVWMGVTCNSKATGGILQSAVVVARALTCFVVGQAARFSARMTHMRCRGRSRGNASTRNRLQEGRPE